MSTWDYWGYKPSRPREAKHGIKAKTSRGAFGTTWWAKRWIAVLESFDIGARLGRGRSYARRGQVTQVGIEQGEVKAKVQGSRPRPYDVVIRLKPFSDKERQALGQALGREALFAAKLLAGEMPEGIEELFAEAGAPLFPGRSQDLKTECSCPDWSNPCKHIAAVYYLMAEEFDRDPFLLLKLRGLTREELPALVGSPAPKAKASTRQRRAPAPESPAPEPSVPLPSDHGAFWGTQGPAVPLALPVSSAAEVPEALLKRLGGFPFWRGERPLEEALAPTYRAAAQRGLALLAGENPFTEGTEGSNGPCAMTGHGNLKGNEGNDAEVRAFARSIQRRGPRGGRR
ncbi:MAG: SWIM zinc finger family protein [Acidobacteriota bacterium]